MIKIKEDYRHKVVKFRKPVLGERCNLYIPYSLSGFGEGVLSKKEEVFPSFYYKFENISRKVAKKFIDCVKRARFTGVFSRDKKVLDELIQQNL